MYAYNHVKQYYNLWLIIHLDFKLEKYLEFCIVQLNHEYADSRESALEMLATIFQSFPLEKLILIFRKKH